MRRFLINLYFTSIDDYCFSIFKHKIVHQIGYIQFRYVCIVFFYKDTPMNIFIIQNETKLLIHSLDEYGNDYISSVNKDTFKALFIVQ
jgi:hypothetical protein